ncbi:MAG TPA: trypsin-like peptidase domain-containing protein [Planctomycetaceae bacterium]|nr:trypsin-like peptidase domain-containing protein [Planctomycetaceae bacterium]
MRFLSCVRTAILLGAAACLAATETSADVIVLKSGAKLEGEVLKERPEEIVVDISVDIVRVPTDQIKEWKKATTSEKPIEVEKTEVFSMADLPRRTVGELAEQFGEAVVMVQTPSGLGSGFILNDQGYCVTNFHVVEKETEIAVRVSLQTADGESVKRRVGDVKIVALNPFFDLALLQIPVQKDLKFRTVYLARDNNDYREGEPVFAIGNPHGLERSVSQGIISKRNRNMGGLVYIQTTAEINPGNSGGPLFNMRGEVVGVTNMKLRESEGMGFAIPVAYLKNFLQNRDAFAFDKTNPNSGYRYLPAPRRRNPSNPPDVKAASK